MAVGISTGGLEINVIFTCFCVCVLFFAGCLRACVHMQARIYRFAHSNIPHSSFRKPCPNTKADITKIFRPSVSRVLTLAEEKYIPLPPLVNLSLQGPKEHQRNRSWWEGNQLSQQPQDLDSRGSSPSVSCPALQPQLRPNGVWHFQAATVQNANNHFSRVPSYDIQRFLSFRTVLQTQNNS